MQIYSEQSFFNKYFPRKAFECGASAAPSSGGRAKLVVEYSGMVGNWGKFGCGTWERPCCVKKKCVRYDGRS